MIVGSPRCARGTNQVVCFCLNRPFERVTLGRVQKQLVHSSEGGFHFMPAVGDMAPDFELKSHLEKDKKVKLSDFRGKKNVVIAFYPLAWTPV